MPLSWALAVGICLQNVPMLDDHALIIQAKDVDPSHNPDRPAKSDGNGGQRREPSAITRLKVTDFLGCSRAIRSK